MATKLEALRARYKDNTNKINAALAIMKRAEQDISNSKDLRSQQGAVIFDKRPKIERRPS